MVNFLNIMHAAGGAFQPMPNFGHMTIASGALQKLLQVIIAEHKDKPVRVNEVWHYDDDQLVLELQWNPSKMYATGTKDFVY